VVETPVADPGRARRFAYRGVTGGVILICIGTVLLLNTLGVLGWGVWFSLLKLWPLLLISIGVRRIFVNTRLHALSLLGPLMIAAATVWVVSAYEESPSFAAMPMESSETLELACPPASQSGPVRLDVDFAAGDLRVVAENKPRAEATPGAAVPAARTGLGGTVHYLGREPRPTCFGSGSLRVRPESWSHGFHIIGPFSWDENRWDARLASDLPVDVDLRLAAATADVDLSAFTLHHLEINAAASHVVLTLGTPTDRVPVKIRGAVDVLRLVLPAGVCFTVRRDRSLSSLDVDDDVLRNDGSRRLASRACVGTEDDGPRYDVDYDLPLSSVSIESEGRTALLSPAL